MDRKETEGLTTRQTGSVDYGFVVRSSASWPVWSMERSNRQAGATEFYPAVLIGCRCPVLPGGRLGSLYRAKAGPKWLKASGGQVGSVRDEISNRQTSETVGEDLVAAL